MSKFSGLVIKTLQPGEMGVNTFRISIGREDGSKPTPVDCVAMLVHLAKKMVTQYGVGGAQIDAVEIINRILNNKKIGIEEVRQN